jgi:hypothetical protein
MYYFSMPNANAIPPPPPQDNIMFEITEGNGIDRERIIQNPNCLAILVNISRYSDIVRVSFPSNSRYFNKITYKKLVL